MNYHALFKMTTYLDINPATWTDEEKKTAKDKAQEELKEAKDRKEELEKTMAELGEVESIQIKNEIEECNLIIVQHK